MLVPLRLKSASMPWPMASCNRMPLAPDARMTGISPAGGRRASNRIIVRSTASRTIVVSRSSVYQPNSSRAAMFEKPDCVSPPWVAVTISVTRVIGRWLVTSLPSRVAIMTRSSWSPQNTVAFSTAGSIALALASTSFKSGSFLSMPTSLHGCSVVYRPPNALGVYD